MSVTAPTTYTCTASDIELFELISNGRMNIKSRVFELLESGANPNTCVTEGGPTVLIACIYKRLGLVDLSLVKILVEWGADTTATYEGKTALEWIRHHGDCYGDAYLQRHIDQVAYVRARILVSRSCNNKSNNATTMST